MSQRRDDSQSASETEDPSEEDDELSESYDEYSSTEQQPAGDLLPGVYRAVYAFMAEGAAEMDLAEDQIVKVLGRGGGDGWVVVSTGDDGGQALVPESYLEFVAPFSPLPDDDGVPNVMRLSADIREDDNQERSTTPHA